jgi:hypothetical protein
MKLANNFNLLDLVNMLNETHNCGGPEGAPICLYDFTALNIIPEVFIFSKI